MAKPDVRVRIAFSDGPYVASPTWTNVTSYVRSINISRGRNDDWTNFDSGSATLVLDNRDRRFDPTYSAGPYYGNLQPRRQVWIDATTNGSTYYEIFRGFIDGWPVNITQAGYDSTVTISCYDVLGLVAQNTAPYDWTDNYIRSLNPVKYYKLDDVVNTSSPTSLQVTDYGSHGVPLTVAAGTVFQNVDSLTPGITSRALSMAADCQLNSTMPTTSYSGVSSCGWTTLNLILPNTYYNSYGQRFTFYNAAGARCTAILSYERQTVGGVFAYQVIVRMYYPTTLYFATVTMELNPAAPHHLAFTADTPAGTPTIRIFIDGIQYTPTVTTTATTFGDIGYQVYAATNQHYAMFGTNIGATAMQTIYNLSIGQVVETTSARFSRVINQTSVPGAFYSATGSPAGTVAKINNGGEPINTSLQLASDSEGGELFAARSGVLTMTNRTYFESGNSKTNQATFGVGGIPIGTEIAYAWNAENIRNALNITWSGDTTINVSDTASIAAYGTMQDNYDTQLSTIADVQNLGSYLVGYGKLPRLVMSAIEVGQAMSAANWNTVLNLELLDRITVVVDEPVGSDLTQVQLIQQLEHEITPGDWRVRILGSSRWTSYFILDTSTLDGTDLLG